MGQNQNGRGVTGPGNGTRGRGDDRGMHGRDDDYGQGQSGYGAGRLGDDRAMMEGRNRNQSERYGHRDEHERGFGIDDRFSGGRGGEEYWLDRGDRPNPQWDHRDRDFERHQRERMGYGYPQREASREARSWNPDEDRFQGTGTGASGRQGMHRGKGPMNFTRSDERIREQICEALTDHHDVDATNIDVVVKGGEVTLTGTVEDRQQKRLAEDIVDRCAGVKDVQNQLKIQDSARK